MIFLTGYLSDLIYVFYITLIFISSHAIVYLLIDLFVLSF